MFASSEAAAALHPLDAVRLEEAGDAAGHLLDDAVLPLDGLRRSRAAARRRSTPSLANVSLGLVHRVRGLHPGLRRDAADAQAGAAELGLLLDADDLRAQLGGADRGRVAAGASAEDGDVTFHLSTFPSEVSLDANDEFAATAPSYGQTADGGAHHEEVVESTFMSLDGVIDNPQNWSPPYWDDEHAAYAQKLMSSADELLSAGRRTRGSPRRGRSGRATRSRTRSTRCRSTSRRGR